MTQEKKLTDEERRDFETVEGAIKGLGGANKSVACFAIAARSQMSIAKTHGILEGLARRGFVEVEANGWRYVD